MPTRHQVIDDRGRRAPALSHIPIEATDAQLREASAQLVLHPFGATAQVADAW